MRFYILSILFLLAIQGCVNFKQNDRTVNFNIDYVHRDSLDYVHRDSLNNPDPPDYLYIPIEEDYIGKILNVNTVNENILFPIKVKKDSATIMIVTTFDFLYPLYWNQIEQISQSDFFDTISKCILRKKSIQLELPTIQTIGEPFYHIVRNDDWVFNIVNQEDTQVFYNYFFNVSEDGGTEIFYADGPYKLGAVAEKMFYLKHPIHERSSCDGTDQWTSGSNMNLEKDIPNISRELRMYLNEFGRLYYIDGNIKYRRFQPMRKWW